MTGDGAPSTGAIGSFVVRDHVLDMLDDMMTAARIAQDGARWEALNDARVGVAALNQTTLDNVPWRMLAREHTSVGAAESHG